MTWTPARVKEASALVSRVLFNRGLRENLERAGDDHLDHLVSVALAIHAERETAAAMKDVLRLAIERDSAEAIARLDDLGVRNEDWPGGSP